jgi:pyruvate,water dikinase
MDLDESEQKQELMIQAQEIRKDMPYIRCEKIILEKLFFETSKRTGIPFELLFYLTPKELLNLFKKPKIAGGLIAVAEERTKFSLFFYTSNSSKIFVDEKARFELKSLFEGIQKNNYEEFFGTIASQGVVKGSIFLVTSKNDLQKIPQNSVVVIEKMMPEDISFIKNAKGVICEEGGLGSHAAILCREYKIPCIVGVKGALTIKSGTTVILDAQKGKITLSE